MDFVPFFLEDGFIKLKYMYKLQNNTYEKTKKKDSKYFFTYFSENNFDHFN